MKFYKTTFLVLALMCTCNLFAQNIIKNEVDKFTKKSIIEFEPIITNPQILNANHEYRSMIAHGPSVCFKFVIIDGVKLCKVTITHDRVFAVAKTETALILLDKEENSYRLPCYEHTVSDIIYIGSGNSNKRLTFYLTEQDFDELSKLTSLIEDIRIYTTDGYFNLSQKVLGFSYFPKKYQTSFSEQFKLTISAWKNYVVEDKE